MKGIYLASCKAKHDNYDLVYQDIEQEKYHTDLGGDMLDVDLNCYDYIIASPPCNYWSRANPYYKTSVYSAATKHLLPCILEKCAVLGKPFIVENVKNYKRMFENGIFDIVSKYGLFVYYVGRHTYFTNIMVNLDCYQMQEFESKSSGHCKYIGKEGYRQGGSNVHRVLEIWLSFVAGV